MSGKLTSRKFWVSVVSGVAGLVNTIVGAQVANDLQMIAGAVITIAVVLGYLKAEKDVDVARAKNGG